MNIHEHIEELVEAACGRFNIPQGQRDEFADSVHELVETGMKHDTYYNMQDFLRDLRGYLDLPESHYPLTLSDYASFTAGFIMAMEFAGRTPELKKRVALALHREAI